MPVKNPSTTLKTGIIPGQKVTKEKLERAKELRREMTPAEKPAKRVVASPCEEAGSPFSEAASYSGIYR